MPSAECSCVGKSSASMAIHGSPEEKVQLFHSSGSPSWCCLMMLWVAMNNSVLTQGNCAYARSTFDVSFQENFADQDVTAWRRRRTSRSCRISDADLVTDAWRVSW